MNLQKAWISVIVVIGITVLPVVFAPASAGAISQRHEISSNWAGLKVVDSSAASTHGVSASWIVPSLSCSSGENSAVSIWVGIGGTHEIAPGLQETLDQVGVDARCINGAPRINAWQEEYDPRAGRPQVTVGPVGRGDEISASVIDRGLTTHWSLDDVRQGKAIWHKSGQWLTRYQHKHTSECIVEDTRFPGLGLAPLANFGKVLFSSCRGIDQSGRSWSIQGSQLPRSWMPTVVENVQGSVKRMSVSLNPLNVQWLLPQVSAVDTVNLPNDAEIRRLAQRLLDAARARGKDGVDAICRVEICTNTPTNLLGKPGMISQLIRVLSLSHSISGNGQAGPVEIWPGFTFTGGSTELDPADEVALGVGSVSEYRGLTINIGICDGRSYQRSCEINFGTNY